MIRLEVIEGDDDRQQFVLYADEPMRVSVTLSERGAMVAHVYEGTEVDEEQEPLGGFDGAYPNANWDVDETHRRCPRCLMRFDPIEFEDHLLEAVTVGACPLVEG